VCVSIYREQNPECYRLQPLSRIPLLLPLLLPPASTKTIRSRFKKNSTAKETKLEVRKKIFCGARILNREAEGKG
jgi:hypothetical protein